MSIPNNISGRILYDLLADKQQLVGLEIGVERGGTTCMLLDNLNIKHLYGIDPYIGYEDLDGNYKRTQHEADIIKKEFVEKISKYTNYTLLNNTSDACTGLIPNDSLDFIFIDGHHSYNQCSKDIKNYYPKIKTGGLISGHDYNYCHGVKQAVDEFVQKLEKTVLVGLNDVWYFIK